MGLQKFLELTTGNTGFFEYEPVLHKLSISAFFPPVVCLFVFYLSLIVAFYLQKLIRMHEFSKLLQTSMLGKAREMQSLLLALITETSCTSSQSKCEKRSAYS